MTGGHADAGREMRAAWAKVLCCLAALVVLAMALPGPGDLLTALVDAVTGAAQSSDRAAAGGVRSADAVPGFLDTAETAVLLAAGVIVWVLLVWTLAIVIIAGLGRLPGTGGRLARNALRRIAPAAAGRLVVAAVGVTAIAGAAGCATPDGAGAPVVSVAPVAATSAAATTDDSTTPQLDIDWPDPAVASSTDTSPPSSSAAGIASSGTPTAGPTDQSSPLPAYDPPASVSSATPGGSPIGDPPTTIPATTIPAGSTPPDPSGPDTPAPDTPSTTPTATPSGADPDGADQLPAATTTDPRPRSSAPDSAAQTPGGALTPTPSNGTAAKADGSVTVRPGDTLWAIAAHHLPADASDAEIDTGWRAWYAANVDVIGTNPDLILPGQHLLPGHSEMRP